jgi:hypothetical protein
MRNCEFCGTEFMPKWEDRQKCCSPECVKDMANFRQNNKRRANKGQELWTLESYHAFLDGTDEPELEPPITGIITTTCTICHKPAGKFDMCQSCERKYKDIFDIRGLYHDRYTYKR